MNFLRDHRRDMKPYLFNQPLFFDEPDIYPAETVYTVNPEPQQTSLSFEERGTYRSVIQIPPVVLGQLPSPMSPDEMSPPSLNSCSRSSSVYRKSHKSKTSHM